MGNDEPREAIPASPAMLGKPIPDDVLRRLDAPPFIGTVIEGTVFVTASLLAREVLALREAVRMGIDAFCDAVPQPNRVVPLVGETVWIDGQPARVLRVEGGRALAHREWWDTAEVTSNPQPQFDNGLRVEQRWVAYAECREHPFVEKARSLLPESPRPARSP